MCILSFTPALHKLCKLNPSSQLHINFHVRTLFEHAPILQHKYNSWSKISMINLTTLPPKYNLTKILEVEKHMNVFGKLLRNSWWPKKKTSTQYQISERSARNIGLDTWRALQFNGVFDTDSMVEKSCSMKRRRAGKAFPHLNLTEKCLSDRRLSE